MAIDITWCGVILCVCIYVSGASLSSLAEAVKDLLQPMSYWHERNTKDSCMA